MTSCIHTLQSHIAIVDHALPRIFLSVLFVARVELALVLLIVLFAQRNLSLALRLPLLNCGRSRISSLLLFGRFLHHSVVDFRFQLILCLCCLTDNLFFLLGQIIVKVLVGTGGSLNRDLWRRDWEHFRKVI